VERNRLPLLDRSLGSLVVTRRSSLAVLILAVLALALPAAAHAARCAPSISGPNDPDFAPAERNPIAGGTFNAEQWPLFDCVPQSTPLANDPEGAAGMSVNRAWAAYGRGSKSVIVAYMEGGVNWRRESSRDLRRKAYLNTGELPRPEDAAGHTHGTYDLDGDGAVTVDDYKSDPRVKRPLLHVATAGGITSEDLIRSFSNGRDSDHNGYVDDISGFNFHRDTNDPQTDQSIYNHANGEQEKLAGEADNHFDGAGMCPNCRLLSVKMGDEAIDRPDRVAEAIVFAVDAGAKVIDVTTAALGQTPSMRGAVEYAYRHGAILAWASNDFESSDHTEGMRFPHVWPGNSVVADQSNREGQSAPNDATTKTFRSRSSLTSYGAHALFSVPTPDGSTSAGIPVTAGVAALVHSAGVQAAAAHKIAKPLNANEVFQVTRATASRIDATPCSTCFPALPGAEWNIQYGYGRPNLYRAMKAVNDGAIPPTADVVSPDWYAQVDPTRKRSVTVTGAAAARRSSRYSWKLQYGLGPQPKDGEFKTIASGSGTRAKRVRGRLDMARIPRSFWAGAYSAPTADRLSIERYDVTVRLRVTDAKGRLGEDRRVFQVRHDPTEIRALHKNLHTSIESSPTLADIEGRGTLDTIVAGSNGVIHAFRPNGREAPGWPVRTRLARGVDPGYGHNYLRARAWRSHSVPRPREPIDAPLAVGDLDHDGGLDVVATGEDGHVYVWDGRGRLRHSFPRATSRAYARQRVPVPDTPYVRNRSTGAVAGAALADLEHNGKLDIVMGGWDGRVYAWRPSGRRVPGWPVKTDTPSSSRHPAGADTYARDYKVCTTPTIVDIDGDKRPDVVVALQDTAFGSSGSPVYGYLMAYSSRGRPLPNFPVTVKAAAQGYGSAQDFITEGVQTPAAYGTGSSARIVANPGLYFSYTIDPHSGSTHQETPASLGGGGPVNPPSPIVHFTTSASIGHVGEPGSALLAFQSGSAVGDVASGIVATPGLGIRVRSAMTAWDPATGANQSQFTREIQGLGFLSAPALADVSGDNRPDVIQPSDSGALHAWDGRNGQILKSWPKWTGGWTLFTPAVGDLNGDGRSEVVVGLREGTLHAYRTPGRTLANRQAWHWHQNDRDTGHYGDDTRPPAGVRNLRVRRRGKRVTLRFMAPGGDWNAGRAKHYEVLALAHGRVTQGRARRARVVRIARLPRLAGRKERLVVRLPRRFRHFAVRAVDAHRNIGPLPLR
jgi:hypothetical protein